MNIDAKVSKPGKKSFKVKVISLDSQRVFCVTKEGKIENYPRAEVTIEDKQYLPK